MSVPIGAYTTIVGHEYAHFIDLKFELSDASTRFYEGFADSFSHLLYDTPIIGEGYGATWGGGSGVDISTPGGFMYPCSGGIYECGRVLAAVWWDIKVAMEDKYDGTPPLPCPLSRETGETCGLAVTRKLFTEWAPTAGGLTDIDFATTVQILRADDDDGDLSNGTPNFHEICLGFVNHGLDCPFTCLEEGYDTYHDQYNIENCQGQSACKDEDPENGVPDGCERVVRVQKNGECEGAYCGGLYW